MSNRKLTFRRFCFGKEFCGFKFRDDFDAKCTLRKSDDIKPHIWLGIDESKIPLADGRVVYDFMHLNRKQARQLAEELLYFAENGHLRDKETSAVLAKARGEKLRRMAEKYAEAKAAGDEAECKRIERAFALWGYKIMPFEGKWQIKQ